MLVRLGIYIPIPGIDREAFQQFIQQGGQLIGFLDIFTGGGISALGIFALGILPFINASIILQLLTAALPSLEDLQKNEGEAGRRKIAQITRYVALGWGVLQSIVFAMILRPLRLGIGPPSGVCGPNRLGPGDRFDGGDVDLRGDHRTGHWPRRLPGDLFEHRGDLAASPGLHR